MTPIKCLGVLLMLASGGAASLFLVRTEREKVRVLDRWVDLIRYIRTQIDCYLTPLDRIFSSVDPELLPLRGVSGTKSAEAILARSLPYLDEESERLLSSFVREIGSLYREEQIKRCDYFAERLSAIRDRKREDLPARLRLCAALPVCAMLGLSVLLW